MGFSLYLPPRSLRISIMTSPRRDLDFQEPAKGVGGATSGFPTRRKTCLKLLKLRVCEDTCGLQVFESRNHHFLVEDLGNIKIMKKESHLQNLIGKTHMFPRKLKPQKGKHKVSSMTFASVNLSTDHQSAALLLWH